MLLRFFLPSHTSCEESEQNREQGELVTEHRISFSPRLPLGLSPPPGGFEQEPRDTRDRSFPSPGCADSTSETTHTPGLCPDRPRGWTCVCAAAESLGF